MLLLFRWHCDSEHRVRGRNPTQGDTLYDWSVKMGLVGLINKSKEDYKILRSAIHAYDMRNAEGSFVMIDNVFYEAQFCKVSSE